MASSTTSEKDQTAKRTLYVGIGVAVLLAASIAYAATRPQPDAASQAPAPVASPEPAPSSTLPTGAPASRPTTGAAATGAASARPSGSGSVRLRPGAPTAPAKEGARLTTLTAPPMKTIGMIAVPAGFKGARYTVVFKPFGWGPSGPDSGRLVAQIEKSTALDEGAKKLDKDFSGRNATLWMTPVMAKRITLGGSYTGTMEVRPQGDVGVLYIIELEK